MKVIKFILKCILEGLKVVIPMILIVLIVFFIFNYLLSKQLQMIISTIFIICIISFVIGIIKLEEKALKKLK